MSRWNRLLGIALHAVDLAEPHIGRTATGRRDKAAKDPVTDTDLAIETLIRTHLHAVTPDIGFFGEEHGGSQSATRWVLDPIDGTANYARSLPLHAISLALIHQGRPVIGVIAAPALYRRYWASDDTGAYSNGTPIAVSSTDQLDQALVAVGDYGTGPDADTYNQAAFTLHHTLAPSVARIRMLGSAALDLALVADGSLDASITLSNQTWDMAAGVVIARRAGAVLLDIRGNPHTLTSATILAVTPALHQALLTTLHPAGRPATRSRERCDHQV